MITIRKSDERGHHDYGWLNARYSFSFARYYDPAHMGFGPLRVINQDIVAPGRGFGEHPHDNMEIISYVISGAIAHKDSTGSARTVRPGQVQHMSAGTGVTHSEFNPSATEPLHLLQVWIEPEIENVKPAYHEATLDDAARRAGFAVVASRKGENGGIPLHADATVYATLLEPGRTATLALAPGRRAWVQLIRGGATVNGTPIDPGDGAAITGETAVSFVSTGAEPAEALLFDLA